MISVTSKITHPPNRTQPLSAVKILTADRLPDRRPSPVHLKYIFNALRILHVRSSRSTNQAIWRKLDHDDFLLIQIALAFSLTHHSHLWISDFHSATLSSLLHMLQSPPRIFACRVYRIFYVSICPQREFYTFHSVIEFSLFLLLSFPFLSLGPSNTLPNPQILMAATTVVPPHKELIVASLETAYR